MSTHNLDFRSTREFSPQCEVFCEDKYVARVTERYLAEPAFMVSFPDGREAPCEDEDAVEKLLLDELAKAKEAVA